MKTRLFGQITKVEYRIDWSLDDTYEKHLEDPERYIRGREEIVEYVELNEKTITRGKPKCEVLETIVDVDKQEVLHYTDYVVKAIGENDLEKQQKMDEMVRYCKEQIAKYNERAKNKIKEEQSNRKWYEIWR